MLRVAVSCAQWVLRAHTVCNLVCRRHYPRSIFLPPQFLSGHHTTSTTRLLLHLVAPPLLGAPVGLVRLAREHHPTNTVLDWALCQHQQHQLVLHLGAPTNQPPSAMSSSAAARPPVSRLLVLCVPIQMFGNWCKLLSTSLFNN